MALIGSLLNLTNGAALGSGPGAIAQVAGSDDEAGQINMTAGTATTTGTLCSFDLGTSYSDLNARAPIVIAVPGPGGLALVGQTLTATVTNGVHVVIACVVAPTISVACPISYVIFA